MRQLNLAIFTITLLFSKIYSSELKCPDNSAEWCSSYRTAKACNVLQQCQKNVWSNVKKNNLVNLTLYYETLCPDSKDFINGQLLNAFNQVLPIMNLTLVPYGNAKETYRNETKLWQFTCQHGIDECWGNLFQTCLINFFPDVNQQFSFIQCMESSTYPIRTAATKCGEKLQLKLDLVNKCMVSRLGNDLQHAMAVRTEKLNPAHTYVPWVTLNGVHTEDIQNKAQNDLVGLICQTYTGPSKPDACN